MKLVLFSTLKWYFFIISIKRAFQNVLKINFEAYRNNYIPLLEKQNYMLSRKIADFVLRNDGLNSLGRAQDTFYIN